MGYVVGVDLGTTFTAAAVFRDGERPETVQLGNRAASIPSTVFLRDDDTILTGQAALRRGLTDPGRLAREFKRRFGDPTPVLLGGVPVSADTLTGRMLRASVEAVAEREGGSADAVAVCHPANWGPYKLDLLDQACRHAGLEHALFVNEPEAAAVHYATQERLAADALVAVYDLGGGTFDAAVLRRSGDGFEILGTPDGIERLGGIDFDEAVVGHVRTAVGNALAGLDPNDPATLSTLARVREECVEAKEALSSDTEASVPVVLPGLQTDVRITRVEFEAMIRVPISETIEALRRTLRSADVKPEELAEVLLVGGSSRIPMVAEMVGAELGRPVAVDADPKHVIALGAARVAALAPVSVGAAAPVVTAPTRTVPIEAPPIEPSGPSSPPPKSKPPKSKSKAKSTSKPKPAAPPKPVTAAANVAQVGARAGTELPPKSRRPRRGLIVAAAAVVVLGIAGAVVAVAGSGGGGGDAAGFVSPCPASGDPAACITDVAFDGSELSVSFTDHDVDLGAGDIVPIFFLTDVTESDAGSVSTRTSAWRDWGQNSPFQGTNAAGQSGFTSDEIGGASTAVCVLLGDTSGRVAAGTGNCAALPQQ